jgi:hypothetical protein
MEYVSLKPNLNSIDCRKELTRLTSLRNCISDSITKSEAHKHAIDDMALPDCHEYYAALLAFEKKGFPSRDEVSNLQLTWKSSVAPSKETHGSLIWDRACTLWNIAALESFLATQQPKDKDGHKMAVKHYQNGSMYMKHLLDVVDGQIFDTVDMNKSLIQFWEKALLAQAQVSAYDMASAGGKHSMLSYLAMGAVPVLNDALTFAKDPFVVSNLPKPIQEWAGECKAQSMLLSARAHYHQSVASREASQWGIEIAHLRQAELLLKQCVEFLKSSNMDITQAEVILRRVQDRKTVAERENNRAYGEEIPKDLPPIVEKLLVKNDMPLPETMTNPKVPLFDKL